jgi:hypothetical protein
VHGECQIDLSLPLEAKKIEIRLSNGLLKQE